MRSTFGGLEIGKRGLYAQQAALNTTGHNIANANTPGYTRQRVNMQASRPYAYPGLTNGKIPGQMGTGVEVTEVTRLRDQFLDRQYRNENKYLGYYKSRMETYSKIEIVMKEGSEENGVGLQQAMDRLWGAWQDLVSSAESGEVREEVLGYAKGVTDVFSHLSQSLKEYQSDLNHVVEVKVNEINSIATRIRDLNAQIARVVPHGYSTNDLNDQRDLLIDQLSEIVDVQVTPAENGMVNISIAGGQALVIGNQSVPLEISQNSSTGFYDVSLGGGEFAPVSGSLLETLEARGIAGTDGKLTGVIPEILGKIDTLATVLAKEVNQLHMSGTNLSDAKQRPFFVSKSWYESLSDKDLSKIDFSTLNPDDYTPKHAGDLLVNPEIVANSDYIAAGGNPSTGPADGNNAQAIAYLKNKMITTGFPNTTTMDGFYASIIGDLGIDAQLAENLYNVKQNLVNHVENRRQSVTGVSLDDEMAAMIKYQHAYSAAARTITVMDEILNKVINGMGVVGR
jgi:flagellar hook-associated protein 1 FlgK